MLIGTFEMTPHAHCCRCPIEDIKRTNAAPCNLRLADVMTVITLVCSSTRNVVLYLLQARGHGGPDKVGIAGKSSDAQPAGT